MDMESEEEPVALAQDVDEAVDEAFGVPVSTSAVTTEEPKSEPTTAEPTKEYPLGVDEPPKDDWVLAIHIHGPSLGDLGCGDYPRFPKKVARHVAKMSDLYNDEVVYLGVREGSIIVLVAVPAEHGAKSLELLQGPALQDICSFAPRRWTECSVTAELTDDLSTQDPRGHGGLRHGHGGGGMFFGGIVFLALCCTFTLYVVCFVPSKSKNENMPKQVRVGQAKEEPIVVEEKPDDLQSVGTISTAVPEDLQSQSP